MIAGSIPAEDKIFCWKFFESFNFVLFAKNSIYLAPQQLNVEWMDGVARMDGVAKSISFLSISSHPI